MQETNNGVSVGGQVIPKTAQGVMWLGGDGNVYVKAAGVNGVQNVGNANTWNAELKSYGYPNLKQIADPNPQNGASNNTAPSGGGSSGGLTAADKTAYDNDINMNQSGLNSLTAQPGIDAINSALGKIMGNYEGDLGAAKTSYTNESTSNQQDLQSNKEVAMQNAVQGRQGLFGTLGSLGALNGTGLVLANNAVAKGANEDLGTAANTFATNQSGLDNGYNAYTAAEKKLEETAKDAAANDIQHVNNDTFKTQQQYLSAIASDYAKEGNTAAAKDFAARAAALFPQINSTNVPTINIGYSGAPYVAPTLQSYASKANNTSVTPTPGAATGSFMVPGLIAANRKQGS